MRIILTAPSLVNLERFTLTTTQTTGKTMFVLSAEHNGEFNLNHFKSHEDFHKSLALQTRLDEFEQFYIQDINLSVISKINKDNNKPVKVACVVPYDGGYEIFVYQNDEDLTHYIVDTSLQMMDFILFEHHFSIADFQES